MADIRESLLEILQSEDFNIFYRQYLQSLSQHSSNEYDLLQSYIEKIKTPECYIAILGIQGAGKSSLLNALLFGDEILPVAVEETTCIPTLVRRPYQEESIGAEIHFSDGRVEQIPLERQFLEKVVDNRYNPRNIMDVSFVVCRTDSKLLEEGFVFVDLPGVGSLTAKNEQTTLRFLQKTHVGIFLLRTVPPITESEAGFIKVAWPRLQESIFVQNLWAKETEREVQEGMSHNERVLAKIAENQHTNPPQKILPVNVAIACQSSFNKDEYGKESSGLTILENHIREYAQVSSMQFLYQESTRFFLRLSQKVKEQLQSRLTLLDSDRQKVIQQLEDARKKFAENQATLDLQIQQLCDQFMERMSVLKNEWLPQHLEITLENMLKRLDKIPLEDLPEEKFRQEVREVFGDLFGIAYRELKQKLGQNAEEYVHNLSKVVMQLSGWEQILKENLQDQNKTPSKSSGLSVALAGSIAPLLLTGPVGWSILGGALVTGGLVRWISGATLHQRIIRGLRKTLGDSKIKIWQDLSQEISQFAEKVRQNIADSLQMEMRAYQVELNKIQQDLSGLDKDQKPQKNELEKQLQTVENFIQKFNELLA